VLMTSNDEVVALSACTILMTGSILKSAAAQIGSAWFMHEIVCSSNRNGPKCYQRTKSFYMSVLLLVTNRRRRPLTPAPIGSLSTSARFKTPFAFAFTAPAADRYVGNYVPHGVQAMRPCHATYYLQMDLHSGAVARCNIRRAADTNGHRWCARLHTCSRGRIRTALLPSGL
jgi:hypothetical protein